MTNKRLKAFDVVYDIKIIRLICSCDLCRFHLWVSQVDLIKKVHYLQIVQLQYEISILQIIAPIRTPHNHSFDLSPAALAYTFFQLENFSTENATGSVQSVSWQFETLQDTHFQMRQHLLNWVCPSLTPSGFQGLWFVRYSGK